MVRLKPVAANGKSEALLLCSVGDPPLCSLVLAEILKPKLPLSIKWGRVTEFRWDDCVVQDDVSSARAMIVAANAVELMPDECAAFIEVDSWLELAEILKSCNNSELRNHLSSLNQRLNGCNALVGNKISLADYALWASLQSLMMKKENAFKNYTNVEQFCRSCVSDGLLQKVQEQLSRRPEQKEAEQKTVKDEGKYIDLPGAVNGKIVVRFPPEASGYLHIGHAKAAMLNQYYRDAFNGKLIMRFDDTNPAKETEEFEEVILRDLEMLQIKPDMWSRTSDYFEQILAYCELLLANGQAYVDDTDPELMKQEREQRKPSKCRDNDVEKNKRLFDEMKRGTELGLRCCVRMKMNMASDNGCLRDPTIYRCKAEEHVRTKGKYKVYPTYDFACPIVDSIEGVTHALRTTEYHDRDEQYYTILEALNLRKPYIYEYSRLNLMNTVMSKRKLTWLVTEGVVEDWSDPRLPTVRGVLRRGMTVEGLKQFIVAQGSSKAVVMMDWNKLWAFNRKARKADVIDPVAPRFISLCKENLVPLLINDAQRERKQVAKHPKNPNMGERSMLYGPKVLIEQVDANLLENGATVTLVNWGNIVITDVTRSNDGNATCVKARLDLENTNYKNTLKFTWLAEAEDAEMVPVVASHFDNVISKAQLGKNEDFKDYVCYDSRHNFEMLGEAAMRDIRKGDIVQLQRKGFFICDQPYCEKDPYTGRPFPLVLFDVPDGHEKELPTGLTSSQKKIDGPKVTNKATKKMEKRIETRKVRETIARSVCFNIALTFKDGPVGAASQVITPVSSASFTASKADSSKEADSFLLEIYAVGNKIRGLKAQKADKKDIEPLVVELKELKERFQAVTGQSWNPNLVERLLNAGEPKGTSNKNSTGMSDGEECLLKIKALGDKIRQLKAASADKKVIEKEVDELKALKATYKTISGHEWNPGLVDAIAKKTVEVPAAHVDERPPKQDTRAPKEKKEKDKACSLLSYCKCLRIVSLRLGLEVRKEENFPEWYSQVITKSEMIAYYDISGCYVIRPWAYFIWEQIQSWFDGQIKRLGVSNCYFPIFVSQTALEREKTHVADFSPEVAWVTKSGKSDLAEPVAIRPTSETVMYPSFARWIQSHRDLPLKINQWCNIVRWEFKHPTPFLRTREFLWQEGHTAYASKEDAVKEVYDILNLYARVYEELLAVPVIKGRKTEKEKFAGADFTTTIESYIPSTGRGIQAATSHHLGQNFSKMFEIVYEHPVTQKKEPVYQNSWGLTTRTIGVFTMIHGDNRGLVMPPRVAKFQVVIIPCGITASLAKNTAEKIYETCNELEKTFCSNNVRCMCDLRDNYSPGWKFSHWELKGVPVRLEVGPRDLAEGQVVLVRRDDSSKTVSPIGCVVDEVKRLLDAVQQSLFNRAKDEMDKFTVVVRDWKDFCARVDSRYIVLAPFCTNEDCEDQIKKDSAREESTDPGAPSMGAKSLCIPFEQPEQLSVGQKCIHPMCNRPAECYTLFGRSY
ncbi:hypothetical protein M513_13298 [Trichuris suis]|uniref:Uncharacterized protein n=1 Tax=Trichuris suis TaxID=68888 RepID=A0A085LLH1_9BILA|nr:hypothetical protein M513_13298 [Trichuris suis]